MEKKGLFVLLLAGLCLLTVACGKDEDKKDKKEESSSNVLTLKCNVEKDGEKVDLEITIDAKEGKVTKGTMTTVLNTAAYKGMYKTDKELEAAVCETDDEEEYKSCEAKVDGDKLTVAMEFNPESYTEEIKEENDFDKLDKKALEELKEEAEDAGYTCKLS